jgi:SAM-dependent methyltransferase
MTKKEIAVIAKTAASVDKDEFILKRCAGKTVLDVGCIGQDRNFTSENWLHNKVKQASLKVDGVDILLDQIEELKRQGYSMYSVDELSGTNNKYSVILMADVIEHVNDPVAFLTFYMRYLEKDGVVVVSTPNANRSNNAVNIFFNNNYSVNDEHTFWFCPKTFCEVASRAGMVISEFYWAKQYYGAEQIRGIYQKLKFRLIQWLASMRSNFNPNMMFVLVKK